MSFGVIPAMDSDISILTSCQSFNQSPTNGRRRRTIAKVRFYFPREIEYAASVEVEDPTDYDQMEEALDKAYEQLPGGVCAHCSGWGSDGKWSLDLDTMDLEAQYAEDEKGNVVWGERPG